MTVFNHKKAAFALSALTVGMMTTSVHAEVATASQIIGMEVSQISANVTQVRLNFDGKPVEPLAYQQTGSNQLILDFNKIGSSALQRNMPVDVGVIKDVMALSNGNLSRLMVNLKSTAVYTSRIEGNQLVLEVVDTGVTAPTKAATRPKPVTQVQVNPLLVPANAQKSRGNYEGISAVNYNADSAGGGSIQISLVNENIPVDVQRQGNKIVVRTTGANIPRHLLKHLEAGGLVSSIDASNQGQSGMLTINMSKDFEYQAYQSGSQLVINVKPAELLREPTLEEKVYKGEPLSLEFQDVPVRTVLDVLGKFTNQNIVSSDAVAGNITLRLINVPWDQALDIILRSKDLDKRVNGNVIVVDRAETLAAQDAKRLKDASEIKDLAPLRTEYIRLSYANAQKVFEMIQNSATNSTNANNRGSNTGLLSARGSVLIDTRTNTLIVKDTAESINNLRVMLEKIDIPVSQVMVEARIISANDTFSKELGVRWGFVHDSVHGKQRANIAGTDRAIWDIRKSTGDTINFAAGSTTAVDLGVGAATGRLAFGLLNIADSLLDLELSAMQADQRGEVISSPKVLTSNNQKAKILSGTKIAYNESAPNGGTTTNWIDAALVLEVTPNITPDGKIGLTLMVNNGSPVENSGSLAVKEDSIETNVVLEDGQTVVLGGVYRNTATQGIRKVPFLGDLPYVGRLFKNDVRRNDKQELLIFITPKIVNDGVSRIQ